MKAIVIDDSRAIRMVIRNILREVGFEVLEAGNGREALEVLEESGDVDLALVDWNMPEMNGLEFVKALRANQEYKDLPVCMVTTETEMSRMVEALEAGANDYLMKPFAKDALLEKLVVMGIEVD